jgi:hypothetical protein
MPPESVVCATMTEPSVVADRPTPIAVHASPSGTSAAPSSATSASAVDGSAIDISSRVLLFQPVCECAPGEASFVIFLF